MILPWPDLMGARDQEGGVVVGMLKSRSKECRTRLVFYDPDNGHTYVNLATRVGWSTDHGTIAILAAGLMALVNGKRDFPLNRATYAVQVLDTKLFLYEAGYRGTIWPRYWWWLSLCAPDYSWGISEAIQMETLSPNEIVGHEDTRSPVSVEWFTVEQEQSPRFTGDYQEYVRDILNSRAGED